MKNNSKLIFNLLFGFFVFMSLNLPSIKLVYSSEILNILALGGILAVGIIRWVLSNETLVEFNHKQLVFIFNFLLLWLVLFTVTSIVKPQGFGLVDFLQYLSVILFTFAVLMFLKKSDLTFIAVYQVLWGTGVGFLEWTVGIPKSRDLGQTYLTSGVVLAATIVVVVGLLFSKELNIYLKAALLPVLLVLYAGITSLSGRAPILLSLIVPAIVYFLSIVFEPNTRKKVLSFIVFSTGIVLVIAVMYNVLNTYTINRISRIFLNIQEEPRYEVYQSAFQVIVENPMGIGLKGYQNYDFGYPHNIFLEVAMSGGLIALIPFVSLIFHQFLQAVKAVQLKTNALIWLNLALYFFLTWNISFELSSSYMVFTSSVLFYKSMSLEEEPVSFSLPKEAIKPSNYINSNFK